VKERTLHIIRIDTKQKFFRNSGLVTTELDGMAVNAFDKATNEVSV